MKATHWGKILLATGFVLYGIIVSAQIKVFNGSIVYKYADFNPLGEQQKSMVEIEKVYYTDSTILSTVVRGSIKDIIGDKGVLLDLKSKKLYEIDFDKETKHVDSSITEASLEIYDLISLKAETILNYECDVYQFKRVYSGPYATSDTLLCTYFVAKRITLSDSKGFAKIQGNQNVRSLDGSLGGITLKYEVIYPTKKKTSMIASEINSSKSQPLIDLSSYTGY